MTLHVTNLASLTCDYRFCPATVGVEPGGGTPLGWTSFSAYQRDTLRTSRKTGSAHLCATHSGLLNLKSDAWKSTS